MLVHTQAGAFAEGREMNVKAELICCLARAARGRLLGMTRLDRSRVLSADSSRGDDLAEEQKTCDNLLDSISIFPSSLFPFCILLVRHSARYSDGTA